MINPGKMDRSVILQRSVETVDSYGRSTSTWSTLTTVRAEIVQNSAEEFLQQFGEAQRNAMIFRIRWLPAVTLTTADRIVYAGQNYDLIEVIEIGRKRGLELRAEKI